MLGGSLNLTGGEADAAAVRIQADNGIDIDAGTGGITIDTIGSLSIDCTATNAAANLSHVGAIGNDLTIDCSVGLSNGEADAAAVRIQADNNGGIDIDAGMRYNS